MDLLHNKYMDLLHTPPPLPHSQMHYILIWIHSIICLINLDLHPALVIIDGLRQDADPSIKSCIGQHHPQPTRSDQTPTTNTNHQPPVTNYQPPTTDHQPPTTNHQPATTNHRTTRRQTPSIHNQPQTNNHHPPSLPPHPHPPTACLGLAEGNGVTSGRTGLTVLLGSRSVIFFKNILISYSWTSC